MGQGKPLQSVVHLFGLIKLERPRVFIGPIGVGMLFKARAISGLQVRMIERGIVRDLVEPGGQALGILKGANAAQGAARFAEGCPMHLAHSSRVAEGSSATASPRRGPALPGLPDRRAGNAARATPGRWHLGRGARWLLRERLFIETLPEGQWFNTKQNKRAQTVAEVGTVSSTDAFNGTLEPTAVRSLCRRRLGAQRSKIFHKCLYCNA